MFINFYGFSSGAVEIPFQFLSKKNKYGKFVGAIILFAVIFLVLGTSVGKIWFREDDLGTILNGLVNSWQGLIKVFSTDVRDFICPVNYHRSAPNILSGFLRPLQHFLFTIEFFLFGDHAYPYFLVHVGLHSLNAVLLYVISLWFFPVWLAFFAGLFFALYPDVSWLTWIATAQNTLCTLFLLLTFIFYYLGQKVWLSVSSGCSTSWLILSGFMFFLSLLARENVVAVPIWFLLGAWLLFTHSAQTWWQRLKIVWSATWVFFLADGVYWFLRWSAFGFGTLSRTLSNVLLRFPMLAPLINMITQKTIQVTKTANVISQGIQATVEVPAISWFASAIQSIMRVINFFIGWLSSVLMIDLSVPQSKIIALIFFVLATIFLVFAYRQHLKILSFLFIGITLMSWPALVAYPCPRYLNTIYPVVSLMLVGGCFLAFEQKKKWLRISALGMMLIMSIGMFQGIVHNRKLLRDGAAARAAYKKRFDLFFSQNQFVPGTRFIVISSPFVSDIQSIFQIYLHDSNVQVAHEPFTTLAEQGIFSCSCPYRTENVASSLKPIEGGFRFVSGDSDHCAWWIHFSDHPLAWSAKDRAYVWTDQQYKEGIWYSCSLGKFKINHVLANKYLIDVSFIFDYQWVNKQTIFIGWDTLNNRYVVLDTAHLIK